MTVHTVLSTLYLAAGVDDKHTTENLDISHDGGNPHCVSSEAVRNSSIKPAADIVYGEYGPYYGALEVTSPSFFFLL